MTFIRKHHTLLGASLLLAAALGCRADLLLYEGFDYPPAGPDGLNGKSGGTGFAAGSSWTADANNQTATSGFDVVDGTGTAPWTGVLTSVPRTGNFAGSPVYANVPDHLWAYRGLGPAVTSAIASGTTLWMSYAIAATHFNNRASFAIGAGELKEDRGALANGQAIGIGNGTNAGFGAAYWKDENGSPTSCGYTLSLNNQLDTAGARSPPPPRWVSILGITPPAGSRSSSWPDSLTWKARVMPKKATAV